MSYEVAQVLAARFSKRREGERGGAGGRIYSGLGWAVVGASGKQGACAIHDDEEECGGWGACFCNQLPK